jgi:hypothetical protein
MRVHPISLALQYLEGKRAWRAAPYYGAAPFHDVAEAVTVLKRFTKQDFGTDARAWRKWLRANRAVYSSALET